MRKLKFRAYSSISEGFIEPIVIDGLTGRLVDGNATLSQFTGLKDVKGKEIYEGDKILLNSQVPLIVEYRDDCFVMVDEYGKMYAALSYGIINNRHTVEVTGNIFESPTSPIPSEAQNEG